MQRSWEYMLGWDGWSVRIFIESFSTVYAGIDVIMYWHCFWFVRFLRKAFTWCWHVDASFRSVGVILLHVGFSFGGRWIVIGLSGVVSNRRSPTLSRRCLVCLLLCVNHQWLLSEYCFTVYPLSSQVRSFGSCILSHTHLHPKSRDSLLTRLELHWGAYVSWSFLCQYISFLLY